METVGGIKISLIFELENEDFPIDCKLEFSGISTFVRYMQSSNACSHISETFGGIKIFMIFEFEKACDSIICKLEFGEISTVVRFSQWWNEYSHME